MLEEVVSKLNLAIRFLAVLVPLPVRAGESEVEMRTALSNLKNPN
jgi:hypothetical protein